MLSHAVHFANRHFQCIFGKHGGNILDVGRTILKCISNKYNRVERIQLIRVRQLVGFCEDCNETSGFHKKQADIQSS